MPRKKPAKPVTTERPYSANKLPIDRPVAVYYRQSGASQIGNYSTAMQQEGMPKHVQRLGWPAHLIVPVFKDGGKSGTLPIPKRAGMAEMYQMIINRAISAVAVFAENR